MAEPSAALSAALDGFFAYASVERRLAPRTLDAYGRDLARFAGFLAERRVERPDEIRREHLTGFVQFLEREGLQSHSRRPAPTTAFWRILVAAVAISGLILLLL